MTEIIPRVGGEEIRQPEPFEGVLPPESEILGRSDLLDPTSYRRLPEDGYVRMQGRREAETASALSTAVDIAPETAEQIRVDLIVPALVSNLVQVNGKPDQIGAVLSAIGDSTANLAESQRFHRGYFSLPPLISRAVIGHMLEKPENVPELFSAFDGERTLSLEAEVTTRIAEQVTRATTREEVIARIAIARSDYSEGDAGSILGDPCNSTDARTFRYSALTGQLVDPAYYESDMYAMSFPQFEDWQDIYNNIRHMMIGFDGPAGNDHMFLYANRPDRPNAVASAKGDYSQCRSGNYLFHDLAIMAARTQNSIEAGDTWIERAPFEVVLDYAALNYLGGMMIDKERLYATDHTGLTEGILFSLGDTPFHFPLKKVDRIIPARILQKGTGEARLYGPDDYLAELVDIAMKIDEIHEISGRTQLLPQTMLDRLYTHAQTLRPEAEPRLRQIASEAQTANVKPLHISYSRF